MLENLLKAFPAFRSRNYRLYFISQLISLIGTWIEIVAHGWLVFILTHSAFWVGVVSALGLLPTLLFGLLGGVVGDRVPKRNFLILTQIASLSIALTLAILTMTNLVNLVSVSILAFLMGVVNAFDNPTRFAMIPELVQKEDLPSAMALNASMFNGARVIGPALSGILIASVGIGGAFLINALSFIPPIIALRAINLTHKKSEDRSHPFESIKQGLKYAFTHKLIKTTLIYCSIIAIFGWSYVTIMPVVTDKVFQKDATGLGFLHAAAGIGALLGSIFISIFSKKFKEATFIILGSLTFVLSMMIFSFTNNFYLGMLFLLFSGVGLAIQNITMVTTLQHHTPSFMRGRIMSIFFFMILGMSPIGSFQIGFFAQHFGPQFALRLGAVFVLIFGIWTFYNFKYGFKN